MTRAAHQAEELAGPLRESGADVILLPAIGIAPPANPGPLRRAAADCAGYDWIIFTSANGVEAFTWALRGDPSEMRAQVGAIGAATREAAERKGFRVSVTPEHYVAESLLEALGPQEMNGLRILIPSAAITRDAIAPELRQRGAQVDVVEAYRNVLPPEAEAQARAVFREPYPDWVLFASSSAVDNLVKLVGVKVLGQVKIASIGPVTSATIRGHSLEVSAEANPHTTRGLVDAVSLFKAGE